MMNPSDTIRYIGVDDTDIDLFESQYRVPEGMSYNSYVILDEKVAVMDTADQRKSVEWQKRMLDTLDGREIDYLVVHHMEPDHAANIAGVAEAYPKMKIVLSAAAAKMLPNFFPEADLSGRLLIVKEGDTLSLGQHTLQFIAAPMVHWPEVLMSYEQTEKVLFAADGFGKFGAIQNEKLNADGTPADWACEARRYYFNIVGKYGMQVQNVLKKAAALDTKIRAVKHAINRFNVEHEVPGFGMTIDQMLVYIPQLTRRKQKLLEMQDRLPKQREPGYGANIIDYSYANYDIGAARADYAKVSDELARAQTALDVANSQSLDTVTADSAMQAISDRELG